MDGGDPCDPSGGAGTDEVSRPVTRLEATILDDPVALRRHVHDLGVVTVADTGLGRRSLLDLAAGLGRVQAMPRGDRADVRVLDSADRSRLARVEAPLNRFFHSDLSWWDGVDVPITCLAAVCVGPDAVTTTELMDAGDALGLLTDDEAAVLRMTSVHHDADRSWQRRHPDQHAAIVRARRLTPGERARRWRRRRSVRSWNGTVVATPVCSPHGAAWPAITAHPITRREVLRLGDHAWRVADATPTGVDDALLDTVQRRLDSSTPTWVHRWSVGDLLLWDNWQVLHRAGPPQPGRRRLERVVALASGGTRS